ncbi:acyltransferase [Prochlorococcus sp. AH-736-K20]|nr:acyltransferase family protein [Prochlorococcus sp. AH-736-K20]MDA9745947.1 acyltransferase [Prochlorococcus sp. AH-736-K20]
MSAGLKKNNLSIQSRYRPEIDGLRAFAVVTVIINHFNKDILPSGYLGVDIFFVISGFVITSSLFQRPSKNFKDFISGFYERRIKRLVPALSFFVLITSIAICLFNPQPILSLKTGITSLFGLSNLYLFKQSTDYFGQTTELNVFTHTWSLGVEEQFYILYPLIIWFSGFGRQTKNGTRNLFLIVGALTIASLIIFLILYPVNQSGAYFLMPTRFWEMASGCLLFITLQKRKNIGNYLKKIPSFLILGLIIGIMYLPISWATVSTVSVVGLSIMLIASLERGAPAYKVFTNHRVVFIGLISYSLYLWHWGVLSISRWTIGIHWWSIPFQIGLIFGIAYASYRYIEKPLRNGNWLGKRWKTLAIGGGTMVTLSCGLFALIEEPLKGNLYSGKIIKGNFQSDTFDKTTLQGEVTGRNQWGCDNTGGNKITDRFFEECLSAKSTKPLVAFSGDSHTAFMFPISEVIASTSKFDVFSHSKGGCIFPAQGKTTNYGDCNEAQLSAAERILEEIRKRNDGSILIATSYLQSYFGYNGKLRFQFKKYPNGSRKSVENNLSDFINASKKLARKLNDINASLILVAPFPEHPEFVRELCTLQWFRPSINKYCFRTNKDFLQRKRKHIVEAINELAREINNIYIYDAFKTLCDNKYCYAKRDNIYLFRDTNHISTRGAVLISEDIVKMIENINSKKN